MTSLAHSTTFIEIDDCSIEVERRGSGPPLLLLVGEERFELDAPFVDRLAQRYEVVIPSPPGFGRSNRPDWITGVDDIAYLYLDLIERLELGVVPVVGCSLGGWIAVEMATKDDAPFAKLALIGALGIKTGTVTDRDIADVWLLHPDDVQRRKWFDPQNGKRDYSQLPDDQLLIVARDRETFARFCWEPYMHDPKLTHRLHRIGVPTLFVWGRNDGIVSPEYGSAYAGLVPGARLALVPEAGHYPHLEQPQRVLDLLEPFLAAAR